MNAKRVFAGLIAVLAMSAAGAAPNKLGPSKPFVVHEWGTFLSVQGSDGVTLGGMVDSDEVLPPFVETFGPASYRRAMMFIKMETPVTYFYTQQPRTVNVRVNMPQGILTHWYPLVKDYGPNPGVGIGPTPNSYLDWKRVELLPATAGDKLVAPVSNDLNWGFARQTDSALVKVAAFTSTKEGGGVSRGYQYEKFLFYRGLGTFGLPLTVQTVGKTNDNFALQLKNKSHFPLTGLFAIQVEKDSIRFGPVNDLAAVGTSQSDLAEVLGKSMPLDEGVPLIKEAVARSLTEAGLYQKEAQAMVNTWERSYFRTDGLRMLYILPRQDVDATIPIHIQPGPDQLVRVMVGRVEVLTPQREQQIEKFISNLGANEFRIRQDATDGLARLGRIGEPALRRVSKTTKDPEVRARAEQLIQKFAGR